jgi:DNA (cytosine-5)-methyltransferase 1
VTTCPVCGDAVRLLAADLYSGAGGAGRGYQLAGFHTVGIDNRPQPRYPGCFIQADALTFDLAGFDLVHGSPPCHDHTPLRSVAGLDGTGWMLAATMERFAAQPAPWVVENVGSARNRADLLLCGEFFGLRTVRHRRFTIDPRVPILIPKPEHPKRHKRPTSTKNRVAALAQGHNLSVTGNIGVHAGPPCLGIDWMNGDELSQAIPPAYTRYIGELLAEYITATRSAA